MSDDTIHDLVGAYMLGALSMDEFDVFEEHLLECDACLAEIEAMQPSVQDMMAYDAEPLSETLIQSILAAAEVSSDAGPLSEEGAEDGTASPLSAQSSKTLAEPRVQRSMRSLFALAAGLAIIALAAGVVLRNGNVSLVDSIVSANDAEIVALDLEGEPSSQLTRSATEGGVAFVGQNFSALETDERYALWALDDEGAPTFVGFIQDQDQQDVTQAWEIDTGDAVVFALSIETVLDPPATPSDRITYVGSVAT